MDNKFIRAGEVAQELSVSKPYAYKLIRQLNEELKEKILNGEDKRLLVVIGPCSIHDLDAAMDYAKRLQSLRDKYQHRLEIVMRTYFEKPRTVVGWKGLISDPDLNGSYRVNHGIELARKLLLQVNELGVPTATEFLDMVTGQFIADLISWGAIGARTTESQIHREMASALSCPVGFKNGTDGNTRIAVDAIRARLSNLGSNRKSMVSLLYPLAVSNLVIAAMNLAAEIGVPQVNADVVKGV